jgi:RNA polymerase sigma-70 factor, ECF subfamily
VAHRAAGSPDRLFRTAYALCGSRAGAEELVLETIARARRRRRYGDAVHLMRDLHRSWRDRQRGSSVRPATTAETIDWVVDRAGHPHVLALDVERAYDAIAHLPPQQREAIAAVDVLGLTHREAARALRIRRRTLTSRLYRARERVTAALQETT